MSQRLLLALVKLSTPGYTFIPNIPHKQLPSKHQLQQIGNRIKKLPYQTARQEQPLVVSRSGAST